MAVLKEDYIETIRQLVPIFSLSAQFQNELFERSELLELRKGKYLFKQGDHDEYSFYLLEGELELQSDGQPHSTISGTSDSARYPLAQLQPRQFSARAKSAIKVLRVNRNALDKLLVMQQESNGEDSVAGLEVGDIGGEGDEVDWMTRILQSELFSKLPTANIHQLFTVLEPVEYSEGDLVIQQGEPGDYYYIVKDGTCEVFRCSSNRKDEIRLTQLKAGDSFGEEALLAGSTRNASVRMLSDGILMRLSKDEFLELIKKPALNSVDYGEACSRIKGGAKLLDVRLAEEYQQSHIENSRNMPLTLLYADFWQLPTDREYIVYCDSGSRSSVAAFFMTQRGYRVSYLEGGLMGCPGSDMTQETTGRNKNRPEKHGDKIRQSQSEKLIDADVRVSAYEAEVAVSEQEIQAAERQRATVADDENRLAQYEAIAKRLRKEHEHLQSAKKRAAEEARRMREEEESRIRKLREETERELQNQKKKLEEVYAQNAQEMEKLTALKQQAEEQARSAREKAEKESAEAQRRMQEAETIKQQLNAAKSAIERQAEEQLSRQAELEQKLRADAMRKLEAERKNLAEQYQRSNEALENAQREKAAAEAARKAAQEEAQRIVAEFKEAHAKVRAEEEAKLQAERERLEQQSRELRQSMASANKAREEAEAARQAAEAQLAKLKIMQAQQDKDRSDKKLNDRIKAAEAEATNARQELTQAEKAHKKVQAAQANNIRELQQQSEEEKKLRAQIEAEVSEWLQENELEAPSGEELKKQAEHLKRIKERAEQAKRESKQAAQSLLNDISRQLSDK